MPVSTSTRRKHTATSLRSARSAHGARAAQRARKSAARTASRYRRRGTGRAQHAKYGGVFRDYVVSPIATGAKLLSVPASVAYRGGKWVAKKVAEHPVATALIVGAALGAGGFNRGYYSPTDLWPQNWKTRAADLAMGGNGREFLSRGAMAKKEIGDSIGYATEAVKDVKNIARHGYHAARNIMSPLTAGRHAMGMVRSSWRYPINAGRALERGAAGAGNIAHMWRKHGFKPLLKLFDPETLSAAEGAATAAAAAAGGGGGGGGRLLNTAEAISRFAAKNMTPAGVNYAMAEAFRQPYTSRYARPALSLAKAAAAAGIRAASRSTAAVKAASRSAAPIMSTAKVISDLAARGMTPAGANYAVAEAFRQPQTGARAARGARAALSLAARRVSPLAVVPDVVSGIRSGRLKAPVVKPNGDMVVPNTASWRLMLTQAGITGAAMLAAAAIHGKSLVIPGGAALMMMKSNAYNARMF